jgi:hypothetical protein
MTVDLRPTGIGTAFRNFDYEKEIARLKRSGGGSSSVAAVVAAMPSQLTLLLIPVPMSSVI